jgi:hypothetical protein
MERVHVTASNDQELNDEERQTLLNGPTDEACPLPDGRTIYYGAPDQDISKEQADAIADAWQTGKITGFGVGQ